MYALQALRERVDQLEVELLGKVATLEVALANSGPATAEEPTEPADEDSTDKLADLSERVASTQQELQRLCETMVGTIGCKYTSLGRTALLAHVIICLYWRFYHMVLLFTGV